METFIQLTEKLAESSSLQCSMVSFIPSLLQKYAQGELTRSELSAEFMKQTRIQQFYFMHMPKNEIQNNQRLFHREFILADQLGDILENQFAVDQNQFHSSLEQCVAEYLRSVEQSEPVSPP